MSEPRRSLLKACSDILEGEHGFNSTVTREQEIQLRRVMDHADRYDATNPNHLAIYSAVHTVLSCFFLEKVSSRK